MIQISTFPSVYEIVTNMRDDDRLEAFFSLGGFYDPEELSRSILQYRGFALVHHDKTGNPVAVAGIHRTGLHDRIAWLLATDDFPKHALGITRYCKRYLEHELDKEPGCLIKAYSWNDHDYSGRWLRILGFVANRPLVMSGRPFTEYVLTRQH